MASHYDSSWNTMKHAAYGCNCNMMLGRQSPTKREHGQAIDELDATCKSYRECQQCVLNTFGEECIAENVTYNFDINGLEAKCLDKDGSCQRALCECDLQFAVSHSAKAHFYNEEFSHIFSMFEHEAICPNICQNDSFTVKDTDKYNGNGDLNGHYVVHSSLVNGRKCYKSNHSLIQYEIDVFGKAAWVMKDQVGTKFYSRSDVSCPSLADWTYLPNGLNGSGKVKAPDLKFNGRTPGQIIASRPEIDNQCCTPTTKAYSLYNSITHDCCADGSTALTGEC